MELNKYQLLYIQTAYDSFQENLHWPTFRQVQRKILPNHRDFRVMEVAKSIEDNPAAHFFQNLDSPVAITLKEIHQLPEAEQDLADLVKVINYSVEKYITEDKDGMRVTSEEINQNLHFDEATIRKIFQLLGLTTGILGSNSNSLDYKKWDFEVSDSAIDFQDLKSIGDYFERRDEITKSYQASRSSQNADSIISQNYDTSAFVMKKQIAPEVIKAISDPKIKQICVELNNTPAENVLSLSQSLGEALKWALWYRAQQVGTSLTVRNMGLSRLLEDAINRPYYSGNAAIKFLKDFNGFLKTGYDMVRHDPVYIPDIVVLNPAIDALEHVLKETFPI
jgi:hypothetical protein